jgi:hypothetical protein
MHAMFLGLSAAAWVMILLALWIVTATLAAVFLGRSIHLGHQLDRAREHRPSRPSPDLPGPPAERVSTAPPGRRGAETSQLPTLGPGGYRMRPAVPPAPLRLGPATLPPLPPSPTEDVATAPHQAVHVWPEDASTQLIPAQPVDEATPRRRVDDAPGEPLRPPQPGGRRRSDQRMTRSEARRIRDGSDDG